MGSRTSSEAEKRMSEAEGKLRLHLIPAQVSFDYFNPYFLSDYIPEHDFYRLLQAYDLPTQSSKEMPGISAMYEALRVTKHRYKLKLSLAFFVLHSNATADIKAELLYLTYVRGETPSVDVIQKLVNNLVDVCLNVSKRLLPGDLEVIEYISKLNSVRKVLFSTLQVQLAFPVTLHDFLIVLTSPQFVPLLTPSSLRQSLLSLYIKHSPSSFSAVRMPLIY